MVPWPGPKLGPWHTSPHSTVLLHITVSTYGLKLTLLWLLGCASAFVGCCGDPSSLAVPLGTARVWFQFEEVLAVAVLASAPSSFLTSCSGGTGASVTGTATGPDCPACSTALRLEASTSVVAACIAQRVWSQLPALPLLGCLG